MSKLKTDMNLSAVTLMLSTFFAVLSLNETTQICRPIIRATNRTFEEKDITDIKEFSYVPTRLFDELIPADFQVNDEGEESPSEDQSGGTHEESKGNEEGSGDGTGMEESKGGGDGDAVEGSGSDEVIKEGKKQKDLEGKSGEEATVDDKSGEDEENKQQEGGGKVEASGEDRGMEESKGEANEGGGSDDDMVKEDGQEKGIEGGSGDNETVVEGMGEGQEENKQDQSGEEGNEGGKGSEEDKEMEKSEGGGDALIKEEDEQAGGSGEDATAAEAGKDEESKQEEDEEETKKKRKRETKIIIEKYENEKTERRSWNDRTESREPYTNGSPMKIANPDKFNMKLKREIPSGETRNDINDNNDRSDAGDGTEVGPRDRGKDGIFRKIRQEPLFAGDIILTDGQKYVYHAQETGETANRTIKNRDPYSRWPNGEIYYKIFSNASLYSDTIRTAARVWNSYTCVNFKEAYAEDKHQLQIFSVFGSCYSALGMIYDKFQALGVGERCAQVTEMLHLFGHVLGLNHEHTRRDRDDHIVIHEKNVLSRHQKFFPCPKAIADKTMPYDFGSVMHLSLFAYSKNARLVIVPKNPLKEAEMYISPKPSYGDFVVVNKLYHCQSKCKDKSFTCQNNGFKTGSAEGRCLCVCPLGFSGEKCETFLDIPQCSGKFTSLSGNINSPKIYIAGSTCVYWIQVPKGRHVAIQFNKFQLASRDKTNRCIKEYLNVRAVGIYSDHPGRKFCGSELENRWFQSRYEDLILILKTGLPSRGDRQLFSASYFAVY